MNKKTILIIILLAIAITGVFGIFYLKKRTEKPIKPEKIENPFGINYDSYYPLEETGTKLMSDIGAKMVRWWVFWPQIEPKKGKIEWKAFDEEVKSMQGKNLEVLAVLSKTPKWAVAKPANNDPWDGDPPANIKDYTDILKAMVERYKPGGILAKQQGWGNNYGVKYWEVWNEPDLNGFWNGTDEYYVKLLKASYTAVKKSYPKSVVSIGGISSEPGLSGSIDITDTLTKYYELGIKGYYDIMNFHWYPKSGPQNYNHPAYGLEKRISMTREVMEKYKDKSPVWITEGSWGDDSREEALQSQFLPRFYITALGENIEKVLWFYLIDTFPKEDFGLMHRFKDGGEKKLSYYTYKLMTEKLTNSDFSKTETIYKNKDNIYVYKFIKNNKPIYVAWWDSWKEKDKKLKTITIPVNFTGNALITSTLPSAKKGSSIKPDNYSELFKTVTIPVSNNQLTFTIGQNPVFIE